MNYLCKCALVEIRVIPIVIMFGLNLKIVL